jgi:putative endonuclease
MVYILTNRRNGTLYFGTTVDLARRVWERRGVSRTALQSGMAYVDSSRLSTTQNILSAKQREISIKQWPRVWKVRLIHQDNPDWVDFRISWPEDVDAHGTNLWAEGPRAKPAKV